MGMHGLRGNSVRLASFTYQVTGIWRNWLLRRSRKAHLNWAAMRELQMRYPVPVARVLPATPAPLFERT